VCCQEVYCVCRCVCLCRCVSGWVPPSVWIHVKVSVSLVGVGRREQLDLGKKRPHQQLLQNTVPSSQEQLLSTAVVSPTHP
jgi:hypothetical protein